jgi:hypothetical protein
MAKKQKIIYISIRYIEKLSVLVYRFVDKM